VKDFDEIVLRGFLRFWWESGIFIIHDSLPLGDRAQSETLSCSPGGSAILGGVLRSLIASGYVLQFFNNQPKPGQL